MNLVRAGKIGLFTMISLFLHTGTAQEIPVSKVDSCVQQVLKTFNVPGIAVGIVHKDSVVLAKGYGISNIETGETVNASTNFGIASNSKAFTATALMLLEQGGRLKLDDKVRKYIPEFTMYNTYVTEEFTIRDLLTHRSGLGLGAGDLMVWPDGHNFTPDDIISNIQYLKPVSGFRTKYDYDNLLYIIAGVVIERVSGMPWTTFIEENFLVPLRMNRTGASWKTLHDKTNVIAPHVPVDGKLKVIERYTHSIFDAAAGLYSNVDDLIKWVRFQLNHGKTPDGRELLGKHFMDQLSKPQTLMPAFTRPPYNTLFRAYGLGFQLQDVAGKLEVSHTGGLEGIVTQVIMYPQLDLGIIVLTNQQEGAAFMAVSNTIKDFYLGLPYFDWVKEYAGLISVRNTNAEKTVDEVWQFVNQNVQDKVIPVTEISGKYRDAWFGNITILKDRNTGKLRFVSERSSQLTGDVSYYKDKTWVVKWDNAYLHADAFIIVETVHNQVTGLKMKPISPLTDFSYDFQDLDLVKIKN
ncbi:MAG TPA: serine hydrolase [Saprospiraceae bacterium]|nr:serine hydrolase [Saprospiraceae bacterium]HRO09245.1 serine hydrolase [Saprospiraceae bacterium]HRP42607.1 serine hydrolase [Saprospiraceae bacterium]